MESYALRYSTLSFLSPTDAQRYQASRVGLPSTWRRRAAAHALNATYLTSYFILVRSSASGSWGQYVHGAHSGLLALLNAGLSFAFCVLSWLAWQAHERGEGKPRRGGVEWRPAALGDRAVFWADALSAWPGSLMRAVCVLSTAAAVRGTPPELCSTVLHSDLTSYDIWALMTFAPLLTLTGHPWWVVAPHLALSTLVAFAVSYLQPVLCGLDDPMLRLKAVFGLVGNLLTCLINYFIAWWPILHWTSNERHAELLRLSSEKAELEKRAAQERTLALGTLAHDIGTPLTALVLAKDAWLAACGHGANDPTVAESVQAIEVSLHAISQLRKTILHHVSLQDNPMTAQLQLVRIRVRELVEGSIAVMLKQLVRAQSAGAVSAIWEVGEPDGASGELEITADRDWLVDMLLNLIGNAVKFTSRGHVALRCTARRRGDPGLGSAPITQEPAKRTDEEVLFAVEDTGVGISHEAALKLFRPFSQVEGTRGGTGLGLASVASKVRIMGGVAGIERNEHGGTTAWFTVPRRPRGSLTRLAPLPPCVSPMCRSYDNMPVSLDSSSGSLAAEGMRVLVVDDSTMITRLVSASLRQLGVAEASTAASGEEALALMHARGSDPARQFHLAIIDSEMGDMRGAELARATRDALSEGLLAPLTLVLLTGNSIQRMLSDEPDLGQLFDALLEKPVSQSELGRVLHSVRSGKSAPFRVVTSAETPVPPPSTNISPFVSAKPSRQGSRDVLWRSNDDASPMLALAGALSTSEELTPPRDSTSSELRRRVGTAFHDKLTCAADARLVSHCCVPSDSDAAFPTPVRGSALGTIKPIAE